MNILGIGFAFLALTSWTLGDFFIQKSVRLVGNIKTLVYIGIVGIIGLFPFVAGEIVSLFSDPLRLSLLAFTGLIIFLAAMFEFEAFKRGKLAVIEPVLAAELPITIALSVVIWSERLSFLQYLLMAAAFIGIILAVTVRHAQPEHRKGVFEKGVIFAIIGSIIMGLVNFLVGVSSQETSPLMTIWFTNLVFTAGCLGYLKLKKEFNGIEKDFSVNLKTILPMSIIDNAAWIFFASAATLIPISIATTVSESYIAFAALLGFIVNKEKVRQHQLAGIAVAIASIIILSAIT